MYMEWAYPSALHVTLFWLELAANTFIVDMIGNAFVNNKIYVFISMGLASWKKIVLISQ